MGKRARHAIGARAALRNVQSAGCGALGVLCDQLLPENFTAVMAAVRWAMSECLIEGSNMSGAGPPTRTKRFNDYSKRND